MSTISTHILDTAQGKPAQSVPVALTRLGRPSRDAPLPSADTTADLSAVGSGTTDGDGRIADFGCGELEPGTYQLRFDTAAYARATNQDFFFPEVTVTFTITDERHYHVPLLLSPFAFSTYRGS